MIVFLLATACILGVMMVGSYNAEKAYAASADRTPNGQYIMVTGAISTSTDLVYVIDVPNRKLLAYGIDPIKNTVRVVDSNVKLTTAFGSRR